MKLVDKKILKLDRIVYYGFSRDNEILDLANECKNNNKVLVVIVPATKNYDKALQESIAVLNDRIWVYELSLGLMANLKSKAELYCELNKRAKLYND